MTGPLLELSGLGVAYRRRTALDGVDLTVAAGEKVALVGESGSGKSTLALAALGLLPSAARVTAGSLRLDGQDVARAPEPVLRRFRGGFVGLVPQDPGVGLNPTMRVGAQVAGAVRQRGIRDRGAVAEAVVAALAEAGIDDPALRSRQYAHELSGGLRQRALIAIALAGRPRLLIADEPTSALDTTVATRILDGLESAVAERGIGLLLITHDLGVATDRADRIVVLRDGRVVDAGPTATVVAHPGSAYTRALLDAAPRIDVVPPEGDAAAQELVRLDGVGKRFVRPGAAPLAAVEGVDLVVRAGETTAVVGESGSGKSTTLRIALGLEQPTAGRVLIAGQDLTGASGAAWRRVRRRVQLVQQNPYASLDPRRTVLDSVTEPLRSFRVGTRRERAARAAELADRVALPRTLLGRRPGELSGGQRQRVAIARALALEPDVLLLDEPVSALDVSVQDQVLRLLEELQRDLGVAYLIVSHDLAVIGRLAHETVVLSAGRVVEAGRTAAVFRDPQHETTRALLAAVPGTRLLHRRPVAADQEVPA